MESVTRYVRKSDIVSPSGVQPLANGIDLAIKSSLKVALGILETDDLNMDPSSIKDVGGNVVRLVYWSTIHEENLPSGPGVRLGKHLKKYVRNRDVIEHSIEEEFKTRGDYMIYSRDKRTQYHISLDMVDTNVDVVVRGDGKTEIEVEFIMDLVIKAETNQ